MISFGRLLTAGLISFAATALAPVSALSAPHKTHLLTIGVCPPWKKIPGNPKATAGMAAGCKNDVEAMTKALRKVMPIQQAEVTTLLNEQATHAGVVGAMRDLASEAGDHDRVVIYVNLHGGDMPAVYKGYRTRDEVLALYTVEEPRDFLKASADGRWMTARAFRDLVNQVQAREIVVIFDSCDSGGAFRDFEYNQAGRYGTGWNGRQAVIFSAHGDQLANFSAAGDTALFTSIFARGLTAAKGGSLGDVFDEARIQTHRDIRARCKSGGTPAAITKNHRAYLAYCTQMPRAYDPYGLLDDIALKTP